MTALPKALIARHGDTCPECGGREVWHALTMEEHNGSTFIDGCGICLHLWERETRKAPTKEPCSNCAWMPGSKEIRSGEIYTHVANCIDGPGIFYCHKRVVFSAENGRGFQHEINSAGTRITNATVCAGWLKAKVQQKRAAND